MDKVNFDAYCIMGMGGDGHHFLYGLLAHGFCGFNVEFSFNYNAHSYAFYYKQHYPDNPYNLEGFAPKYFRNIQNTYKNPFIIGIKCDNELAAYKREVNHWIKNGLFTHKSAMPPYYDTYLFLNKNRIIQDNPILTIEEFKNNDQLIKRILLYQYKQALNASYHMCDDIISFEDLMYNCDKTVTFVEKITNKKANDSLIKTIVNYQTRQNELEIQYKYLYDFNQNI